MTADSSSSTRTTVNKDRRTFLKASGAALARAVRSHEPGETVGVEFEARRGELERHVAEVEREIAELEQRLQAAEEKLERIALAAEMERQQDA